MTEVQKESRIEKTWNICIFLFCLSFFTSKSLLTLMGPVLILWVCFDNDKRSEWITNTKIVFLFCLFPLALILNFFSIGGIESVYKVFLSWHWPLLVAPAICVYKNPRSYRYCFIGLVIGLSLAVLNSFFKLFNTLYFNADTPFMTENFRIGSFWNVSRWGYFSGLCVLSLFLLLNEKLEPKFKRPLFILFSFTLISFIMTNTRGPLIALLIVLALLSMTGIKILKNAFIFCVILFSFLLTNPTTFERVKSIFAVEIHGDKMTSSNMSNASRLYMWKIAKDFFSEQPWLGTGYESTEKPLKLFLQKQNKDYVAEIANTEFSYSDQHSSYLNSIIQMGTLFFILCWSLIFYIFSSQLWGYFHTKDSFTRFCLALLLYCFIVFVFYSSFSSYESIIVFVMLALIGESKMPISVAKIA